MQCHDLVWNSVKGLAGVLQHRALLAPPRCYFAFLVTANPVLESQ